MADAQLCRHCSTREPVREAALKPAAADSYPYLPVRMWTAARRVADLVARYRGIPAQAVDRLHRVLSEQDFLFRDGAPRPA